MICFPNLLTLSQPQLPPSFVHEPFLSFHAGRLSSSSSSSIFSSSSIPITIFLLLTPPHLSMEERVPSSTGNTNTNHNRGIIPDPQKLQGPLIPAIGAGTYVVQVPKNQVYRVPPPENAIIVEQHRGGGGRNNQNKSHLSMLFWIFASIFGFILVLILCGVLIYLIVDPNNPTFSVNSFTVKNNTQPASSHKHNQPQPPHLYTIILKSQNPNEDMGILYQEGGDVELSFKDKQIAAGKLPALYQGYKDLKTFRVSLTGGNIVLPNEIQKSMKDGKSKESVLFSLMVKVPVKMRIGLIKTWSFYMDVSCSFRVDTLTKNINVLSQNCDTAIH